MLRDAIRTDQFDYDLPSELIAQTPTETRDQSRLMQVNRLNGNRSHHVFSDIVDLLEPGTVLVLNNSQVINARLFAKKETGANIELFLIEQIGEKAWTCLAKPAKRLRVGDILNIGNQLRAKVLQKESFISVEFEYEGDFFVHLDELGLPPLPPYIHSDAKAYQTRYQTVYAEHPGSVAAPTAGLHFTDELISKLKQKDILFEYITLHVGYGTFKPVSHDFIHEHTMHHERYEIKADVAERFLRLTA